MRVDILKGKEIVVFAGHQSDTWSKHRSKGRYAKFVKEKSEYSDVGEYAEFESNLDIARNLIGGLRKLGATVHFPQEDGTDFTLNQRVQFCNRVRPDLNIFVHSNATNNDNTRGFAGFYYYRSNDSKRLAECYASSVEKRGYPLWSNGLYPCEPGTWSWFYVIRKTLDNCILTENDFFTNDVAVEMLLNPNHQDKIAQAHIEMVCMYFNVKYPSNFDKNEGKDKKPKFDEKDDRLYRLVTGSFANAKQLSNAKDKLLNKFSWTVYEKADSTGFNPAFRLVTGTLRGKKKAKYYKKWIEKHFGWTMYLKEEN
ncbi:hypothetical protein GLW05_21000 [Pontibacillus yanchengensis]|uniref:MurNAc-LAA domain-containing protein n=1 Tax=Pontibacillus yanchengensis TaxID=462910 RepID=A0A6I5A6V4_9BACI|nr:N-acetylmuramoyl-L-alanine amidase [Pontibacillus yanchengensis]MYL36053.1 hypothetical protein [Pontibacillus yanchengensis]